MAARPLRGRAVALLGRRPPMAHRPGASRPSRARLSRRPRPARLRRGLEALWRTRAPWEGGRPHPARSPRGQGCAGARSSSAPPTPPDQSPGQPGGACRFGLGDETAGAVALGLGIAGGDLGISRGELVRAHPPEHRGACRLSTAPIDSPPRSAPRHSPGMRHDARGRRSCAWGAALPSGHGSPPSPPRGCRQSGRPDSRESGPCRGGLP